MKLNDNKQLKELIDNTIETKNIIQQSKKDIESIKDTLNSRFNNFKPFDKTTKNKRAKA